MEMCPNCGKKLGMFNKIQPLGSKEAFCSFKCKNQYSNREIKCTCNKCGKIWYYTPNAKQTQDMGKIALAFTFLAPLKSGERPLDSCPNCFSKDIKKEEINIIKLKKKNGKN